MPQIRSNGLMLEYESFGAEADPAILLVMGLAAQMTLWPVSFCEALAAKGYRVIRFDNRDIGKSAHLIDLGVPDIAAIMGKLAQGEAASSPYSLDDMAEDAAGLLDALGIAKAHIVGASMGGMIAQLVAIRHPQKTKSLVSIMSTTGRRDLPPAKPEAMAVLMTPPASSGREDRIASAMRAWTVIGSPDYPATDAELRANAEREVDRVPYEPTGGLRQMAAIMTAPARNAALAGVAAPSLVIHGGDDPLVHVEGGEDTAAAIPGARLIIIPGMAHDFTEALSPVYLAEVGGFIDSVEGRT